jgi:hypothetical protein
MPGVDRSSGIRTFDAVASGALPHRGPTGPRGDEINLYADAALVLGVSGED